MLDFTFLGHKELLSWLISFKVIPNWRLIDSNYQLSYITCANQIVMNIEEIREYCIAKPGVTEGFPFDETTLVFKVMNKMIALTGLDGDPPFVNLKCDPDRAIELRGQYEDVQPGWHMNKIIIMFKYTVKRILITS